MPESHNKSIHRKRSMLVTIVGLMFLAWGGLAVVTVFASRAWDPGSSYWLHSDAMWAWEFVGGEPTLEEKRLVAAQATAQMRYELPIRGAVIAWSLVTFVASLGLLLRKNWARLLFIGLMACAVLGIAWGTLLFRSLRMAGTSDIVACAVIVVGLLSIGWKLRSPAIVSEFRDGREFSKR